MIDEDGVCAIREVALSLHNAAILRQFSPETKETEEYFRIAIHAMRDVLSDVDPVFDVIKRPVASSMCAERFLIEDGSGMIECAAHYNFSIEKDDDGRFYVSDVVLATAAFVRTEIGRASMIEIVGREEVERQEEAIREKINRDLDYFSPY